MDVVCFIPGILGSKLQTADGRTVWPPTAGEALTELSRDKLDALLNEGDLTSTGAIENVCLRDVYGGILKAIEIAGYQRTGRGQKRLEILHYDWRLDIVDEIAPGLEPKIEALLDGGAETIHIVAHSMGGLVGRVLIQDTRWEQRRWRKKLGHFITMATPFRGAPLALGRLLGMDGTLGIPARAFRDLRSKPRLRAPYQLLPPPGERFIWRVSGRSLQTDDLYGGTGFAVEHDLLESSLDSVGRLHAILNQPLPPGLSTLQFAGIGFPTATRLARGTSLQMVKDDDGGDETVPIRSATHINTPTMILPGEHLGIVRNAKLQRTITALLGALPSAIIFGADTGSADGEPEAQLSTPAEGVVEDQGAMISTLLTIKPADKNRDAVVDVFYLDNTGAEKTQVASLRLRIPAGTSDLRFRVPMQSVGFYRLMLKLEGVSQAETTLIVRKVP